MRGYISTVDNEDSGRVAVESEIEVYRRDDGSNRVVANTGEREVDLGLSDVTVSRKKGNTPPVTITPKAEFVEIHNRGNSNGVTVRSEGEGKTRQVERGHVVPVKRDAVVDIGYQTQLRLVVERSAKHVTNVHNKGEGDVVMGDKTNVDKGTRVEDAVVKGDIGAKDGTGVDGDDKVDTSDVVSSGSASSGEYPDTDGSDTRHFCEDHGIAYNGDRCPECADGGETPQENSNFCMYCGSEIPIRANHCPDCGERLQTE